MALRVKVLDVGEQRTPTVKQAILRDSVPIAMGMVSTVHFINLVITGRYTSLPSAEEGLWRVLAYAGGIWFFLEVVTMLTNNKRRALHDLIAGTVVVRTA
jgi:hypothetical protein